MGSSDITAATDAEPAPMLETMRVPAVVPSERHSSRPLTPSSAKKYAMPATVTGGEMLELSAPGLMSRTRRVPLRVPSLMNSSPPYGSSSSTIKVPEATSVVPYHKKVDEAAGRVLMSLTSSTPKDWVVTSEQVSSPSNFLIIFVCLGVTPTDSLSPRAATRQPKPYFAANISRWRQLC
jgi:hypothetical protein